MKKKSIYTHTHTQTHKGFPGQFCRFDTGNQVCWRLRKTHQLHSSSVLMHLLLWDVSLQDLGDRSARHGRLQQPAVRGGTGTSTSARSPFDLTLRRSLSWCSHLNREWCPGAAAGRSCSAWKWALWWWPWWPAVRDRTRTAGAQAHPAMEDLTSTLFWTSKCSDFYWTTVSQCMTLLIWAVWSSNKHVHAEKKA